MQPQKVLVVDDEFLIRWALAHALSEAGYEVSTVEDGLRAIELARQKRFDFIVTDLAMPGLDGWSLLEMSKQLRTLPKVIVMTANAEEDSQRRVLERGGWGCVEKSCLIDGVKETLKAASGW